MGREVGGGFRMGNTCTPMAGSYQCMAKTLQYYKVISLQLKLKKFLKRNDLFLFPRQTIQYHSNPVCALISNAEKAEVEWFYEDLQNLLELTPQKNVLFIIGDWNAKVGYKEIPGITAKFGLGVQN